MEVVDLLTFTKEQDTGNDVSFTSSLVTIAGLPRHIPVRLWKDYGAAAFSDSLRHTFKWRQTSATQFYLQSPYALSGETGTIIDIISGSFPSFSIFVQNNTAIDTPFPTLRVTDGLGTSWSDASIDLSNNTYYWFDMRIDADSKLHTCDIYSNEAMTILVESLAVTPTSVFTYDYLNALANFGSGTLGHSYSGNSGDYVIQDVISGIQILRRRMEDY